MSHPYSHLPVRPRLRDTMSRSANELMAMGNAAIVMYVRRRYAILFYSLLLTFVASPVLAALQREPTFLELLLAANLLLALVPIRTGQVRRTLVILVVLALAGRFFAASLGHTLSSAQLGIWTLVGLLAAANALRSVLRSRSVESEHIYAALSAYLLAGISFGILYWVLERTWPGSLFYGGGLSQSLSAADGIYFSFVTLATVGYGDFVPKTEVARGLVILEAVAGQLYLGVMVARLVSLYVSGAPRGRHDYGGTTDLAATVLSPPSHQEHQGSPR